MLYCHFDRRLPHTLRGFSYLTAVSAKLFFPWKIFTFHLKALILKVFQLLPSNDFGILIKETPTECFLCCIRTAAQNRCFGEKLKLLLQSKISKCLTVKQKEIYVHFFLNCNINNDPEPDQSPLETPAAGIPSQAQLYSYFYTLGAVCCLCANAFNIVFMQQ